MGPATPNLQSQTVCFTIGVPEPELALGDGCPHNLRELIVKDRLSEFQVEQG